MLAERVGTWEQKHSHLKEVSFPDSLSNAVFTQIDILDIQDSRLLEWVDLRYLTHSKYADFLLLSLGRSAKCFSKGFIAWADSIVTHIEFQA